jgi:DNA (cytosine-5)-methyltransferase 1
MSRPLDRPLPTITTSGKHSALIQPYLINNYGQSLSLDINDPHPTVTGSQHTGLVEPFLSCYHGGEDTAKRTYCLANPIPTLDTSNRYGLVSPFIIKYYGIGKSASVDDPLDTVVAKDKSALIDGDRYFFDIRYRMLLPHELSAAQGFPKDYIFEGTKTDVIRQIGNAVPVNTARNLSRAALIQYLKGAAA